MAETLLYVALDKDEKEPNLELAEELARSDAKEWGPFGFKINQDHATIWGKEYIEDIVGLEHNVFVDLKMNNGARTMSNTARWLGDLGVTHTNVWAHADSNLRKMMDQLENVQDRPGILAVTFYTRWKESYAQKHHRMGLEELIAHWTESAVDNKADGVILPGNMLHVVEGVNTKKLNPAVRIEDQETSSKQEQTTTPFDAAAAGADMVVVGSPIYEADVPVVALKTYLWELSKGAATRP